MPSKILRFLIFVVSFSNIVSAQTYYQVGHLNGTLLVNGVSVTVTAIAGAGNYLPYCGSAGPYFIGNGSTVNSGYQFSFSSPVPVTGLRMHMSATGTGEILSSKVNGSAYTYTMANLSSLTSNCTYQNVDTVIGGNITVTDTGVNISSATVDINPGYAITSFSITHSGANNGGTVFDLYFAKGCPDTVIAAASHDTVCVGDTLNLLATGPNLSSSVTFSWSGPNGFSSSQQNPVISGIGSAAAGTYTVTASESGLCTFSATSSIHISVIPAPVISASSNSPICPGDTLHLYTPSVSGASYQWNGPNSFSSTVQDPFLYPLLIADTGNYVVTASLGGCHSSVTTHVSAKPFPPLPVVNYNSPVCVGDTLKLNAANTSATVNYNWTGPNSFTSALQNPQIPNAQANTSGTYIVIVSDTNACTTSAVLNVTVGTRPANLSISVNNPVCYNRTLLLSANSTSTGLVYSWIGPNNMNSTLQNPSVASVNFTDSGYYHLVASLNGCSSLDSVHISVSPTPLVPLAGANGQFCAGDTLFLTATDTASGLSYSWTGPNGFSSGLQNPFIANTQNADSGNYFVRALLNGCYSDADSVDAVIYRKPIDTVLFSGKAIICSNIGSFPLAAIITVGESYQWYNNGILIPGANSYQYFATSPGSYNVHIFNQQGCSIFTYSVIVGAATAPSPGISAQGNVLSTGVYASYEWNLDHIPITGTNTQSYTALQNGTYTVTVTDSNGCSGTSADSVIVSGLGLAGVNYNGNVVSIFPNPASSVLNIEANCEVDVCILSIEGKLQFRKSMAGIIDISKFPKGIYLVKVWDKSGVLLKIEKIVKE